MPYFAVQAKGQLCLSRPSFTAGWQARRPSATLDIMARKPMTKLRLLSIVLLASASFNSSAIAAPDKDSAAPPAERTSVAATPSKTNSPKKVEDLPNFHEVHPFLYRGGEPTEAGLKKLKEMGVKTLIDLRAPSERKIDEPKIASELGLNYINMTMTSKAPTKKQVDTFLKTVKEAQESPEKGPVLVHCAHGSDRTGCMVGIWRVTQEDWGYDDTYKEMRKYWFTPKFTNLSGAVKERAKK